MPKLVTWVACGAVVLALLAATGCAARDADADGGASAIAPRDALRRLPAPARRGAARLSLVQRYRPCAPDDVAPLGAPGGCAAEPPANLAAPPGLATAVAAARARADARVDADALHALALADLAWSDALGNALDRSISTLRTVARLSARPAPALADLAAALLARADRRGEARDLFEAADVALLALESDSAFAPARFNLALALGRIGLVDETARAWTAFLAVEPRGPWADEARRRAAAVAASAVPPRFDPHAADLAAEAARAPQEARLYGWNEALGRWGAAVLAGDSAAAVRELAWARVVGRALEVRGGDGTLADAVRVIDGAAPNSGRVRALAAAHRAYARGTAHYAATRYSDAAGEFARAAGAPGPLGVWARAFGAGTAVNTGRRGRAEQDARRLLARVDLARYPAAAAQLRWVLSTSLLRMGRTEAALREYGAAADAFARAAEREHLGAVRASAAHASYLLGDPRATADAVRDALLTLRPYRASLWRYNALYAAALSGSREGFGHAALRVQHETVRTAERGRRPAFIAEAWTARARMAFARGHAHQAHGSADAANARRALAAIPPGVPRDWLRAELQVVEAALLPPTDAGPAAAARAIHALDSAVAYFGRPNTPAQLVPALVARADAYMRAGDAPRAGADLDRAVALLVTEQSATDSLPLRATLLAAARRVVDRAMSLDVERGAPRAALARLERGRAAADPTLHRRGRVGARLRPPPNTVVVVYAHVGDTLLAWTMAGSDVRLARVGAPRVTLGQAVGRARAALELRTADAARADLARLHDWFVRPVRARLGPPGTRLVVVADGLLEEVPFAALLDTATGRHLVETHAVHHAPSIAAVSRRPARTTRPRAVLTVADPALGAGTTPGLRPLPEARAEAREVAAMYSRSRIIAGADAQAPVVIPAVAHAAVVHYAGHALFDDERPERSALLLTPTTAGSTGALTAGSIASLDLHRVRLVVLSACETARAAAGRGGGFAGLTGAFLSAGAGGVVAAAWRVDDAATRSLMGAFHRAYARSGDAPRALREAQRALLYSGNPAFSTPASWAGFRYVGR